MDRKEAAKNLVDRIGEEYANDLVRKLEKENGPVQVKVEIRVDTPDSSFWAKSEKIVAYESACYGDFQKRGISVKRIENLPEEYEHDVAMLEGEYENLQELNDKIGKLNIFYGYGSSGGGVCDKDKVYNAFKLLEKEFGKRMAFPINFCFYEESAENPNIDTEGEDMSDDDFKIPRNKAIEFLESRGIEFLRYNLVGRDDGLFDDRTVHTPISFVNEDKVADISLKLID